MSRLSRNVSHWLLAVVVALVALTAFAAPAQALTGVDLSTYKRVGRYDLPEPTRTSAPANNLLAQEASGVTYNWDTGTLFVVGDGGTSVTQVSKTGALVNAMTLPPGGSSQGTEFYDTEGIAYVGNGEFVMTEERDRQAVKFTYVPGGTLTRGAAQTVKLGTTIGNIGLEGLTNDPVTGGYIFVKEMEPLGIFQTGIDWAAGTATNGGPAVVNSTNLFNPALAGLVDFSDVFALANLKTMSGPQTDNLLIISQESGKVVNVNRSGSVASSLTLVNDPGNPLSIQQQTHEGVTMDDDGVLYTVSESGGGDADHPQLWVFEPTGAPNQAPTAVALSNQTTSLPENSNTASRLKLADLVLSDDGIGTNTYSVIGPDASFFEAESGGLYLKAGTVLNKAVKDTYEITVKVEDSTVAGSTPVTVPYTLTVTSAAVSDETTLAVTEVAPWGSGDGAYGADWFELTNTGTKTVNLAGWRMDDESASFGAAVTLNGVATLAPGESAIFTEDDPATVTNDFINHWFGGSPPAGFKIGSYTDTGTGLSTGGDQVNIFNPAGTRVTGVAFGASTPRRSFDNTAALGSATSPLPVLTTLSSAGTNGALTVGGETGSPGVAPVRTPVTVSEVAPWGSGNAEYGADWFELTNVSPQTLDLTGWKIDDDSNSFAAGSALTGVGSLAPGESAVFVEGDAAKIAAFKTSWFGSSVPAGLQFGNYAGPGLGTGGDQVNIFNDLGQRLTGVAFGASTTNVSFDNAAGAGSYSSAPTISTLSVDGVNGAFKIHDQIGSPGKIAGPPPLPSIKVTEVAPTGSSASYGADWFELTNTGATPVSLAGWKIDDDSSSFAQGTALTGVASIAAGESVVFVEGDASKLVAFKTFWFGSSVPAGLRFGSYTGPGLGNGGDQVNVFNAAEAKVTGVRFGAATSGVSFDNAAGVGSATENPPPLISTLSVVGTNGAFIAAGGSEVGSPGTIKTSAPPLPSVKVTEVSSTSSSNSTYSADFWELTNTGSTPVDLSGWKVDDDSNSFGSALALSGVTSLAAGESAIFLEGNAATVSAFKAAWFGSSVPAGLQIGTYSGSGIGLSSSGDQVNVFNSAGTKVTGVRFGAATSGVSFDNAAGVGSATENPPPLISTLSVKGTNGAFSSLTGGEVGSPGTIKNAPPALPNVKITEVSSTSSSNSTYAADFWELTNTGATTVDPSGWKVDDDSNSFGSALALNGVTSLAPGESAIFIEGNASTANGFKAAWFGSNVPAAFQIGTYSGSGIGLSSSGDQVNLFNAEGTKITGVRFGAATTGVSFDNAAGVGSATESPPPLISTLSVKGTNGAFNSLTGGEVGSPGTIKNPPAVAPANTAAPSASGTAGIGASLSCAPGTWSGTPAPTFGYQWLRNGAPIESAASSSYTTVAADGGAAVSCEVTATNSAGSAKATSNAIQMPAPGLYCAGVAISGAGSPLQTAAQGGWASAFTASICPSGPAVSYAAGSEAAALAAWNADGVSGAIDTSRAFLGLDRAPDAGQIANVKAAAGSGAQLAVIPVAQTAVAVIANTPAGCTVEEITSSNLVAVFEGRLRVWSDLATAEGSCGAPISRVVPKGSEAVSGQFKNYMFQLNKKALACAPGNATWEQLRATDTVWPESCPAKALSPLLRPGADGVPAAVSLVGSTAGAIGFAPLPDAVAGGAESLAVQNNGFAAAAEATFALPSAGAGANCSEMTYKRPTGGGGLDLDWSEVFGAKPAIGSGAYPLCMLTYAVAFHGYEAAGFSVGQERTAKDYLNGLVVTTAGQEAVQSNGYAPVPASASAQFDILGEARKAAAKITR